MECLKIDFNTWIILWEHTAFKVNQIFKHSLFLHFYCSVSFKILDNSSTHIFLMSFTIKMVVYNFHWGNLSQRFEIENVSFFKQHPLLPFFQTVCRGKKKGQNKIQSVTIIASIPGCLCEEKIIMNKRQNQFPKLLILQYHHYATVCSKIRFHSFYLISSLLWGNTYL